MLYSAFLPVTNCLLPLSFNGLMVCISSKRNFISIILITFQNKKSIMFCVDQVLFWKQGAIGPCRPKQAVIWTVFVVDKLEALLSKKCFTQQWHLYNDTMNILNLLYFRGLMFLNLSKKIYLVNLWGYQVKQLTIHINTYTKVYIVTNEERKH